MLIVGRDIKILKPTGFHDEVGTASKDAATGCQVGAFAHGKGLCLQCVLQPATFH